ncbi:MAG: PfkB family carbohydrate kinase [Pseudomonadota bacterium]
MSGKTVAAISSWVMRGTIGLRAIGFVLERRGHTVWSVPTVTLPWHPGLGPSTKAPQEVLPAQLGELAANPHALDGILTGYFVSAEQVMAAAAFIDAVRRVREDVCVLVDPIIGDEAGRYVPAAVASAIMAELVPRADVITPNINELAELSGGKTMSDAKRLAPSTVVVTSAAATPEALSTWVVTKSATTTLTHPRIDAPARGTGDLFSGLFMALCVEGRPPVEAARIALAATYRVVKGSGPVSLALTTHQEALISQDVSAVLVDGPA